MAEYEEKLLNSINTTGFILENKISKKLEANKWSVISNRYYEDDLTSTPREIDIIAYKVYLLDAVQYYFTLIISCKKSATDKWVLFTRNFNDRNPNMQKYPYLYWSNDKILNTRLSDANFLSDYSSFVAANEQAKRVIDFEKNVFAFQQFDAKSGNKKDDKDIYNSVITAIKASNYERKYLPTRKNEPCIYSFNLVSIFDGEMFEANCDNDEIHIEKINEAKYVNRFIVGGKDRFYRTNFITYDKFDSFLLVLEKYERELTTFLNDYRLFYFTDLFKEPKYSNLFYEELKNEIDWLINYSLRKAGKQKVEFREIFYNKAEQVLEIQIDDWDNDTISKLNNDEKMMKSIKEYIKKYYRYDGEVKIAENIPF